MKIMIEKLLKSGWTKWKISKALNVSWHTVYMWQKEVFRPTKEHLKALEDLLEKNSRR